MCLARLKALHDKEPLEVRQWQLEILKEQFELGIVEPAPQRVPQEPGRVVHYLPYRALQREGKDIRTVYDASAKPKGGLSLNDCVEKGPSLTSNRTSVVPFDYI